MKCLNLLIACLVLTRGVAVWADIPLPKVEILPNGLEIAWFEDHKLPLVDFVFLIKSGYRDDPKKKTGVAQMTSVLLDRGSGNLDALRMAREIEKLGATRYISADDDLFTVGIHGLSEDSLPLLELLRRMVLKPSFPEKEFLQERRRYLDRWKHVSDHSSTLATLGFRRLVSSGTIYGRGGFLSVKEFEGLERSDVVDYHQQHFVPSNAILAVVGDVNPDRFRQEILKRFLSWHGPAPKRNWFKHSDTRLRLGGNKALLIDRKGLNQAQVRIGFEAPKIQTPEHYALVVANALLGEYFNSRLNRVLRDDLALTYAVGSSLSYSLDFASFTIASSTRNEAVGRLVRKALEILQGLIDGPIEAEEVQEAKDYLTGGFPLTTATIGSIASRWLIGRVYGLGPNYMNEFVSKVSAVTVEAVREAVKKHFKGKKPIITIAGDAKAIRKDLKNHRLWPAKIVSAESLRK